MAKKKLLVENNYEFILFGISCPEKAYRLCFALNRKFKVSFSKTNDIKIQEKNQRIESGFNVFAFRDEEMFTDYRVIVNKSENKFLVPEFRQADYLLMVQGGIPELERGGILKKLREVTFIQTVFEIDPKKIKSKENFIF